MRFSVTTVVLALVVLLVIASNTVFVVDPGERAITFQFGRIVEQIDKPGFYYKVPLAQTAQLFDDRIQSLNDQSQSITTSDGKQLNLNYFATWRVGDLKRYYEATGGQDLVIGDRLTAVIDRAIGDVFHKLSFEQALASHGSLLPQLGKGAQKQIAGLGVDLVDLRIRDIRLPKAQRQSTDDRMIAERERMADELRAQGQEAAAKIRSQAEQQAASILSNARRDAEKIRGEGDARATRIYARAAAENPDFFRFYRSMEAYRQAFSGGQVLVLRPDSPFFRTLQQGPGK
jgi:HflC protein